MVRRRILLTGASAMALTALRAHAQPAFPTKALRIVVPFAAGGVGDLTARAVATGLAERLGSRWSSTTARAQVVWWQQTPWRVPSRMGTRCS